MSRLRNVLALAGVLGGAAHPMHTSVSEVRMEPDGQVRIAIRVYADDLAGAVGASAAAPSDSAVSRYVRGRFGLRDRHDTPVRLRWDGMASSSDAVVIRMSGAMPAGLGGIRVANLLLTERFRDQVNVVRVLAGEQSETLLFTPGDGAKVVP